MMKLNFKGRKSQDGSVLLPVIGIAAVGVLLLSFFSDRAVNYARTVSQSKSGLDEELVLNAVIDYTKTGLYQSWCFSPSWLKDLSCTLDHPRNVKRLLLSSKTIGALKELSKTKSMTLPSVISMNRIEVNMPLESITSRHPLYKILSQIKNRQKTQLSIVLQREENKKMETKGQEVYIRVTAKLKTDGFSVSGGKTMEAIVMVFPRELSNFGLVVANDLYIGYSRGKVQGDGAVASSDSGSLLFESPVFVNGDIKLHPSKYTPVSFASSVVLGDGVLKRGDSKYAPGSPGGKDSRYLNSIKEAGGFHEGVTLSGKRDLGLDYLSGLRTAEAKKKVSMENCIKRNLAESDLDVTKKSEFLAKLSSVANNKFDIDLGLSHWNRFSEQEVPENSFFEVEKGKFYNTSFSKLGDGQDSGPVGQVEIEFGSNHKIDIPIRIGQTVSVKPQYKIDFGGEDNLKKITNALLDDKYKLDAKRAQTQNLKSDIAKLESELNSSDDDEDDDDEDDDDEDDDEKLRKISELKGELKDLEKEVERDEKEIEKDEKNLAEEQEAFDEYSAPPELKITFNLRKMSGFDQYNQGTLSIEVENENRIKTDYLSVKFNAFDVGVEKGRIIRKNENDFLSREFNFKKSNSGDFRPYGLSSDWDDTGLRNSDFKGKNGIDRSFNYGEMDKLCSDPPSGVSFEAIDPDFSFAESSRLSWNFADPFDGRWNITSLEAGDNPEFLVRSIVKQCVVRSDAKTLVGFLNCDEFIIAPRSQPLQIIGTIITSKLVVSSSAVAAGIWWSSIYHPSAVRLLEEKRILKPLSGFKNSCKDLDVPLWHPRPGIQNLASFYTCSSLSLRERANPFTWTSVDPDCGLTSEKSERTSCKFNPKNFFLKEVGRSSR